MSTWKIGDSWVTVNGLTVGTGGSKEQAKQDANQRKVAPKAKGKRCGKRQR